MKKVVKISVGGNATKVDLDMEKVIRHQLYICVPTRLFYVKLDSGSDIKKK